MSLLEVDALTVEFPVEGGILRAVDNVSFAVEAGSTLGLVGESGRGKSVTSLAILGLLPRTSTRVDAAAIRFEGVDLARLEAQRLRDLRGNRLAMIFQEPMTALNPSVTIGDQIGEAMRRHRGLDRPAARAQAIDMLRSVRMPAPERRIDNYPHQLSGGMRQRAMIAMALACGPRLLIADEPTTALDVTVQAQILDLLRTLRSETGAAILLISHDMGVIAEMADHVAVMYSGRIVERAPVREIFERPHHPYTIGLLGAIPRVDHQSERLTAIKGGVPDPVSPPPGCRFHPRCPFADETCARTQPDLRAIAPGHDVACLKAPP